VRPSAAGRYLRTIVFASVALAASRAPAETAYRWALEPAGWTFGAVVVERGVNVPGTFGFAMMEKQADRWRLTDYDKLGTALRSCTFKGRAATC
jgi:hypothetical protein